MLLKSRPDIDAGKIGLIGHSEGALVAPLVAGRSRDVAFIVLMAGTGLPGDEILYLQGQLILRAMGADAKALEQQHKIQKRFIDIAKTEKDRKVAATKIREAVTEVLKDLPEDERKAVGGSEAALVAQAERVNSPWFRFFLAFDPRTASAKVRCPVLALNGSKDTQVPPKEDLSEIEKALTRAGNTSTTIRELPGLNHLFQTCKTGTGGIRHHRGNDCAGGARGHRRLDRKAGQAELTRADAASRIGRTLPLPTTFRTFGRQHLCSQVTGEGLEPSTNGLTYLIGFHRPS